MRGPHPQPQSHPFNSVAGETTPIISDANQIKRDIKRGDYNCGRCGQPKKGHSCHIPQSIVPVSAAPPTTPTPIATPTTISTSSFVVPTQPSPVRLCFSAPPIRQPYFKLRRALSFDDGDVGDALDEMDEDEKEENEEGDLEMELDVAQSGKLPMSCLWEVLKRLPPSSLLAAAMVCKGWRETSRRLWKAAEELILRVPASAQIGFVGSVLQKCKMLVRISLIMESVIDATMLTVSATKSVSLQEEPKKFVILQC